MAAILVTRNANEPIVVPVVGSGGDCIWQQSGVWSQAVGLCWCVLQESGFICREVVFSLLYKNATICIFNVIFKDNAAINFVTVQHKSFIPVNFDGSYAVASDDYWISFWLARVNTSPQWNRLKCIAPYIYLFLTDIYSRAHTHTHAHTRMDGRWVDLQSEVMNSFAPRVFTKHSTMVCLESPTGVSNVRIHILRICSVRRYIQTYRTPSYAKWQQVITYENYTCKNQG
jgi:hypothetical protein